ncbi:3-methyl-2-oxobutanoate dehydrogenase subunit beta, partial [bacterium]
GDYHTLVLAPWSVQEMYDLTILAFDLSDKYRIPAMILADAMLGMMKEPLDEWKPSIEDYGKEEWVVTGAKGRERRRIKSLYLGDGELAAHNWRLHEKHEKIAKAETRVHVEIPHDCEMAVVAFGSAARIAKTAVDRANAEGRKIGIIRPITVWPFPYDAIKEIAQKGIKLLTVELNIGQMVEDVKIAANGKSDVAFLGYPPGYLPSPDEIYERIMFEAGAKELKL